MMCKKHRNLRAACEMYWKRLHALREAVSRVVGLSAAGKVSDEEAEKQMADFETEMQEIEECLSILEHLFRQTACDEK